MGSGLPWDVWNRYTCRAWGDPHVDGFDGNRNDVYGGAIYSLSETTGLGFAHLVRYGPWITFLDRTWPLYPWSRLF